MREFRKKQKRLFKLMKSLIIFTVIYILIYIGIEPTVQNYSAELAVILNYVSQILIILNLPVIFIYYSRYGKCDSFLERTEYEISDYAYYFVSYDEMAESEYVSILGDNFKNNGYSISQNIEIDEFDFDITASKKKEFFYVCSVKSVSRNDVLA